jgi:hypothetical protein
MNRVEYSEKGIPVNDFYALSTAENIKLVDNLELCYSTSNIFNAIRLLIVQDKLDFNNIVFVYKGEEIKITKYGSILNWPDGFLDLDMEICEGILFGSMNKYKKEKENGQPN